MLVRSQNDPPPGKYVCGVETDHLHSSRLSLQARLYCFQGFCQHPGGFLFTHQALQRFVIGVHLLYAPCDELVPGATRSQAGQPTHGSFVFLGDTLPQASNLTVVLLCVHERVPSFCLLCSQCSPAPHASEEGKLLLALEIVSCLPKRPRILSLSHCSPGVVNSIPQICLDHRTHLPGLEWPAQSWMIFFCSFSGCMSARPLCCYASGRNPRWTCAPR